MADTAAAQTQTYASMSAAGGSLMLLQGGKLVEFPLALLDQKFAGVLSTDVLGQPDSLKLFGQVDSFDALRKVVPAIAGMRISLRGWNSGSLYGGGEFVSVIGNAKDDGGMIASPGSKYYWQRCIPDLNKLDVTHFGAIPDGKTDCATAFGAMFAWTEKNLPGLGVQFPGGKFFLSQWTRAAAINLFRVTGAKVNFGYFPATTIISDFNENKMLLVSARKVEIANLIIQGQNDVQANKKGFFENTAIEGQFFNLDCVRFEKLGGTCVKLVDTLDTRLHQWYASQCTGDVLVATWSNSPNGKWDHSTAIELSNFNIQKCTGGKVFDLPRCTQSFMYNGWIEHCDNPGDISNGQWVVTGLSMEDCKTPLKASYSRLVETGRNLQSGSSIDYTVDTTLTEWLSEWERGRVDIQNYGVYTDGSLEFGALMSRNKLSNSAATAAWFKVGRFFSPAEGDEIDINLVGTGNFLASTPVLNDIDDTRQGGGSTLIRLQYKKDGAMGGTLMPMGSSPIQAAKFVKDGSRVTLYVQLKGYTRNVIPIITATGSTHFEKGVSFFFRPDIASVSDADIAALTNATDILEQWSIGQKAGVGATNDGDLILKGKIVGNFLQVRVLVSTAPYAKSELRYIELKTAAK